MDIEKLLADREKLHQNYVSNCGEDEGTENMIFIDYDAELKTVDRWEQGELFLSFQAREYDLDINSTFNADDDDVVHILEHALDTLNEYAVIKVLEFVGKKINKLKSALESLKGL